jgi:hypothetical protein
MTVEYIVLGAILIVMGAVQTWLRHGPGAKELDKAQRSERPATGQGSSRGGVRSGRAWESWTAVLGGVSIVLGILLVVLGVLGR